jgi:hypothetical protein
MINLTEAMTAQEVQDQSAQHYDIDSKIMQMMRHMTIEQKQKLADACAKMASGNISTKPEER